MGVLSIGSFWFLFQLTFFPACVEQSSGSGEWSTAKDAIPCPHNSAGKKS